MRPGSLEAIQAAAAARDGAAEAARTLTPTLTQTLTLTVTLTPTLAQVVTPYWMAPEIIQMSGFTTSADIWSVGCTVHEARRSARPQSR